MLTSPDSLNKYSRCAAENAADGGACVGVARHIAKTQEQKLRRNEAYLTLTAVAAAVV